MNTDLSGPPQLLRHGMLSLAHVYLTSYPKRHGQVKEVQCLPASKM